MVRPAGVRHVKASLVMTRRELGRRRNPAPLLSDWKLKVKKQPLYDLDECLVCGSPYVERHHVYPSDRRKISEREGCIAPLCREHHQGRTGVHQDRGFDLWLKADCQRRWMERESATIDDFRRVFYANYIDEEE